MRQCIKRAWHWMALLLSTDAAFIFSTWIIRREALPYMALFFLLFTALILVIGLWAEVRQQRRDEAALLEFLEKPDDKLSEKTAELCEYQDYIEAWVHEVKTPLSLFTLVMSNHRDEMSPYVYARLNYVQHQINEDVERILYYARLQADHSDVKFTRFRLEECVSEVLDEYRPFIEENQILLTVDFQSSEVVSDRKIVSFMLSQLLGNAVKYADSRGGKISMAIRQEEDEIHLRIDNNGDGVPPEDVPFIFDKGFTGNYPNRQKATGMGLYLVRKYAERLCVKVQLNEDIPYGSGFSIELIFVL